MKIESGRKREERDSKKNLQNEKGHHANERDGASLASREVDGKNIDLSKESIHGNEMRESAQKEHGPKGMSFEAEQKKVDESQP